MHRRARCLVLSPHDRASGARYFAARGDTEQAGRLYAMAIADHTMAIAFKPHLPGAWNNRGLVYYTTGRFDQAMADFDEAIRLDPDEPRYYQHRCLVWFQLDNTQQALADITKAIDVQPDYAEAYELRGIILGNDGQYEKAFHNFDKAASLDPARSASLSKKKQMLMETRDRK